MDKTIIQAYQSIKYDDDSLLNTSSPPYERNMLLLIKIRKLGRWLIGNRMNVLKNDAIRNLEIIGLNQIKIVSLRVFKDNKSN